VPPAPRRERFSGTSEVFGGSLYARLFPLRPHSEAFRSGAPRTPAGLLPYPAPRATPEKSRAPTTPGVPAPAAGERWAGFALPRGSSHSSTPAPFADGRRSYAQQGERINILYDGVRAGGRDSGILLRPYFTETLPTARSASPASLQSQAIQVQVKVDIFVSTAVRKENPCTSTARALGPWTGCSLNQRTSHEDDRARTRIRHLRSSYERLRASGVGLERAMISRARGIPDEALALLLLRAGCRRSQLVAGFGV
jgi:hypothetical protein